MDAKQHKVSKLVRLYATDLPFEWGWKSHHNLVGGEQTRVLIFLSGLRQFDKTRKDAMF